MVSVVGWVSLIHPLIKLISSRTLTSALTFNRRTSFHSCCWNTWLSPFRIPPTLNYWYHYERSTQLRKKFVLLMQAYISLRLKNINFIHASYYSWQRQFKQLPFSSPLPTPTPPTLLTPLQTTQRCTNHKISTCSSTNRPTSTKQHWATKTGNNVTASWKHTSTTCTSIE